MDWVGLTVTGVLIVLAVTTRHLVDRIGPGNETRPYTVRSQGWAKSTRVGHVSTAATDQKLDRCRYPTQMRGSPQSAAIRYRERRGYAARPADCGKSRHHETGDLFVPQMSRSSSVVVTSHWWPCLVVTFTDTAHRPSEPQ